MDKILQVMNDYEVFSKNHLQQIINDDWHINTNDIKWHANYVERFENENINQLYSTNEYAKLTRWDFWNRIVELFLEQGIRTNLDIGCANNQFSFLCNLKGIYSLGIDPRESCVNISQDVFETKFGNKNKYGYVGTIKTFNEFFYNDNRGVFFDCITVLNFLHGDHHDPKEIKDFFLMLSRITKYVLLSEPKWQELKLPKFTNNYTPIFSLNNGTVHTLYKVKEISEETNENP